MSPARPDRGPSTTACRCRSRSTNAQISLPTGTAAAALMLRAGTGILRTQTPPGERSVARLRRQAGALGVDWPAAEPDAEFAPAGPEPGQEITVRLDRDDPATRTVAFSVA